MRGKTLGLVAWPVEVGSRELDARLVFALETVRRGHAFVSGSKTAVTYAMQRVREASVYIHKSAAPAQIKRFLRLKENNVFLLAHDEEGPFLRSEETAERTSQEALLLLDAFLFFGQNQANQFAHLGLSPTRGFVVGHPRYDLLIGVHSRSYRAASAAFQDSYGRYALLAPRATSFRHQMHFAAGLIAQDIVDTCVIKPHPWANEKFPLVSEPWVATVDRNQSFAPLLMGCKVLLHSESTTAAAASILSVPAVDFSSKKEILPSGGNLSQYSVNAADVKSPTIPDLSLSPPSALNALGDILLTCKTSASERILDVVETFIARRPKFESSKFSLTVNSSIPVLQDLSEHGRFKLGPLNASIVSQRLAVFAAAIGRPAPKVTFYGDSLFAITSDS
jgi:hypothetical protein